MIFQGYREDFVKIFASTFIVFILTMTTNILASSAFVLMTIYFLDGGHVYSTLLEVLADPEEVKKKYVWIVLLGSFFLNLVIHLAFEPYFFMYVFYFTIFHNMRQGLGITFLYRIGEKKNATIVKWSYYFLTMMPFILVHLKANMMEGTLGEAIIKPFDFAQWIPQETLNIWHGYGLIVYFIGVLVIGITLALQKNIRGMLSMIFFTIVYAFSFIYSKNQLQSYALLIFSHAVPYFFLMEKRLIVTHKVSFIKKYAFFFLTLLFGIGALLDYYQTDIIDLFDPFDSIAIALLTTPLISHFIYDAIIWKRGNERFFTFIQTKTY